MIRIMRTFCGVISTMLDLSDCTFNIPVRIESPDRQNNLTLVLDYIGKHLKTKVIIGEQDSMSKIKYFWKPEWSSFCEHIFIEDSNHLFHKTKILNILAKASTTPYIISYDSDILFEPRQYVQARDMIRVNVTDFCYPFAEALQNIPKSSYETISSSLSIDTVRQHITRDKHPEPPPGGCLFMHRQKFINGGMENENMISYGPEDRERATRLHKLGYRVIRIPGPIYHMDHSRTTNSNHLHPYFHKNEEEFHKIMRITKEELQQYVKTWEWCK